MERHFQNWRKLGWAGCSGRLEKRKVYWRFHKNPPLGPILSQLNPVHSLTSYIPTMNSNTKIPCTPRSPNLFLPYWFLPTKILYVFFIICPIPYHTQTLWSYTASVSFHVKYMLQVYCSWLRQHSHSWFRALRYPWPYFSFLQIWLSCETQVAKYMLSV
jgi:hypothetical protein